MKKLLLILLLMAPLHGADDLEDGMVLNLLEGFRVKRGQVVPGYTHALVKYDPDFDDFIFSSTAFVGAALEPYSLEAFSKITKDEELGARLKALLVEAYKTEGFLSRPESSVLIGKNLRGTKIEVFVREYDSELRAFLQKEFVEALCPDLFTAPSVGGCAAAERI